MKQYRCIKNYITEEGEVAFKLGVIYDLAENNVLTSELIGIKYYLGKDFKEMYFKRHKPMTSFEGNGLYCASLVNSRVNGMWTGNMTMIKDSVVESVIKKFQDRSDLGIKKYGTTLDRNDLSWQEWISHAQEEAMDLVLYLERMKKE
ncbi:hypothetical protein [Flavobacterium sp.]|uniref:hypothetical protein n=1 Tax=Flavobacterium sp. TaxID=239 RepID=UPI0025DC7E96|nr:hypothetical protein [Flavobacterium sp.]